MSNYHSDSARRLFTVITSIETPEECCSFFEDLCTIKEIQDMAQRFETALLLNKGYSYQKISDTVGVSTATISRVNRSLIYGSGGYKEAIKKLEETETQDDN